MPLCGYSQDIAFPLPAHHPKTLVIKKVYKNIISVANNQQLGALPSIQVIQRKKNTAAYATRSNTIKIEETTFDLCTNLGKNRDAALAILIAHEFTHFSKKHQGINGFTCDYYDNTNELTHSGQEEEADFWGLFTAHLAGYNVLEVAPNLLATIYQHYGFAQNMSGYPPLQIRQQLGNKAIQKLEEYIQLYEAGNYLTAIGAYEQAAGCYATILSEYQSAELHNNLAVSLIRQALFVAPKETYPFVYPVELAIESRLYRHRKPPFGFDPNRLANSYLQKAIIQLEKALRLKLNYPTTQLNLGIAQNMLGQITRAKKLIAAINISQLPTLQQENWSILKGIIAAKENQREKSLQFFQQAGNNPIAQINQQIITGTFAPFNKKTMSSSPTSVTIDGIRDLRSVRTYQQTISLNTSLNSDYYQPKYQFQYRLLPSSAIWKINRSKKLEQYNLQVTSSPIAFTPEGLQVGSSLKSVQAALGNSARHSLTASGQFLYYPEKGLIFLLNEIEVVQQWGKVMVMGGNF